jgi:hypothetical protein
MPTLHIFPFAEALHNTIVNRIMYRMKVTALLPDQLIEEVKAHAKGRTLTESLTLALEEWLRLKKIAQLNEQVHQQPLQFSKGFSAARTRNLNRRS